MNKKNPGGKEKRQHIDGMRAMSWATYLKHTLGVSTDNALAERLMPALGNKPRIDRYLRGENVPDSATRTAVSSIVNEEKDNSANKEKPKLFPLANQVFDVGPAIDGGVIEFWFLFEDDTSRLHEAISRALMRDSSGDKTSDRVAQVAHLFVTPAVWELICAKKSFAFNEDDNPAQRPGLVNNASYQTDDLQKLAAVIAQWRLSMQDEDRVAPMQYLLHGILASAYYDGLLRQLGIRDALIAFLILFSVEYHERHGNEQAARNAFQSVR